MSDRSPLCCLFFLDTFPYCVQGQVWHLILSICDLYLLYTSMIQSWNCSNFFFGWRGGGWFGMLNIDIYIFAINLKSQTQVLTWMHAKAKPILNVLRPQKPFRSLPLNHVYSCFLWKDEFKNTDSDVSPMRTGPQVCPNRPHFVWTLQTNYWFWIW